MYCCTCLLFWDSVLYLFVVLGQCTLYLFVVLGQCTVPVCCFGTVYCTCLLFWDSVLYLFVGLGQWTVQYCTCLLFGDSVLYLFVVSACSESRQSPPVMNFPGTEIPSSYLKPTTIMSYLYTIQYSSEPIRDLVSFSSDQSNVIAAHPL